VPEGHTLHRLATLHTELFAGDVVAVSSPQGRFSDGAALVSGRRFERAHSYGKHLFHEYSGGTVVHVHLGLYGVFTSAAGTAPQPVGALRMRIEGPRGYADLRGATVCEVLTPEQCDAVVSRLGPDPLRSPNGASRSFARVARSRAPVAALLMDQGVAAGVGNVFRAEVLYRAGLDPFRPGRDVDGPTWTALWADLRRLMRAAVRSGRIVTTRPGDRASPGDTPRAAATHYVYRRAGLPCRRCGETVRTEVLVGRNLFWCPGCQPRRRR
jgi:endonuclease-8